jgi:nucleotide-binding universal stress UspA family protein
MPEHPVVVVGYDGSPASCAALARAVERVGATGHLFVVHGYPRPDDHLGSPYYQDLVADTIARAADLVDGAAALVGDARWDGEAIEGDPAQAIARVAAVRGADEIIVGTRGIGRVRALLGSVAHELIHLAPCPVTVIPERAVRPVEASAPTISAPAGSPRA